MTPLWRRYGAIASPDGAPGGVLPGGRARAGRGRCVLPACPVASTSGARLHGAASAPISLPRPVEVLQAGAAPGLPAAIPGIGNLAVMASCRPVIRGPAAADVTGGISEGP